MANGNHPGQRIRSYREKRGWTLTYLARLLSTSKGYLSDIERELRVPGAPLQRRIEILVGVPLSNWPVEGPTAEEIRQNLADLAEAGGRR
jgi:transcriptional regulator with XRE-family HTH domain